jgi:hypothetical protein
MNNHEIETYALRYLRAARDQYLSSSSSVIVSCYLKISEICLGFKCCKCSLIVMFSRYLGSGLVFMLGRNSHLRALILSSVSNQTSDRFTRLCMSLFYFKF